MRAIQIVDGFIWWFMSRRKRVDGLQIGIWDGDHDAELFEKVTQSLAFIALLDPLRHQRILRDLERIWVLLLPDNLGSFHVDTWCCRLDCRLVLSSPIEKIASVIVHEATHARLYRRGIGYEEDMRARVEAICVRREAAFAARCPQGDELKPEIDSYLALDNSTWTNKAFERRHLRGSIKAFRYLGTPDWLVATFLLLHQRRKRLRRRRTT